jgi:hypothetical protein
MSSLVRQSTAPTGAAAKKSFLFSGRGDDPEVIRFLVLLAACGGAQTVVVGFRVERVTATKDGHDVDDASPDVVLVARGTELRSPQATGSCEPLERSSNARIGKTCGELKPAGTVAALGCGGDPHVDQFQCVYAVRAGGALELWRADVDFEDNDDAPVKLHPRPLVRVGSLPIGDATLTVGAVEHRQTRR